MIPDSIEQIRTSRLVLQPLDPSDAAEMVVVLADPILYEFTGGAAPDFDTLERRYRNQVKGPSDSEEAWYNWIARKAEDQQAVGFVQATVIDDAADVAWLIGVEYQGRGFGAEAASAMCDWLLRNGVCSLSAHIHPRHVASQRVALAIGLAATGESDDDGEAIWSASLGSG